MNGKHDEFNFVQTEFKLLWEFQMEIFIKDLAIWAQHSG